MSDTKKPEDFLPLTPIHLHILIAVSDQPRHGFGILKEIEILTNKSFTISVGTIYNSINRLLQSGLIKKADGFVDEDDDPRRTSYYQITSLGQRTVKAELRRLEETLRIAKQKPALGFWGTTNGSQAASIGVPDD